MDAPKSLLNVMNEIESELKVFCSHNGSKELVELIKKNGCGFNVKSRENKHLGITYENVYISFDWDNEPHILFSTSGDNGASEDKRFKEDEKVFKNLLYNLKKLK